jgi:uncharacterized protein YecT (DUF1311 family)
MTFATRWNYVRSLNLSGCLFLLKFLIIILLGVLFSVNANAASFDCKKAASWVEKTVCANPELSKLDEDMAKAYHDALASLSPEGQNEIREYQKQWIKNIYHINKDKRAYKKEASPIVGGGVSIKKDVSFALKFAYEDRIKEIQGSLSKYPDRIFRNVRIHNSKGDITYPQIENPRDENEKLWNSIIFKRVHEHKKYDVGCSVSFSNKQMISVNGYPSQFSWLLKERRELQTSDIFDDKTDWRNKLVTFAAQKTKELEAAEDQSYIEPQMDELFSSSVWSISEDGLSFDVPTSNFRGTGTITIEWSILDPYLNKSGRSILGRPAKLNDATSNNPAKPMTNSVKVPVVAISAIPQTGQKSCYHSVGYIIDCKNTGQDGELQKGVKWPDPRFTDNGNKTITDNLTGLMWTKDANAPSSGLMVCDPAKYKNFQGAIDYINCINTNKYLGYNDWRLPNRKEIFSLVNYGEVNSASWLHSQGFNNVQSHYWSSTAYAFASDSAYGAVWEINMNGYVSNTFTSFNAFVWPVRSGKTGITNLPKTGQTVCYNETMKVISCKNTGLDGELQQGAAWPKLRFTDNGDLTFTDNLTGLMWTRAGFAPGPAICGQGHLKDWQQALDYAACLNAKKYLGYNDWHVPNINELESLVNAGEANGEAWLYKQGFTNILSPSWSSTTCAGIKNRAWTVGFYVGTIEMNDKAEQLYVWPVRSAK